MTVRVSAPSDYCPFTAPCEDHSSGVRYTATRPYRSPPISNPDPLSGALGAPSERRAVRIRMAAFGCLAPLAKEADRSWRERALQNFRNVARCGVEDIRIRRIREDVAQVFQTTHDLGGSFAA